MNIFYRLRRKNGFCAFTVFVFSILFLLPISSNSIQANTEPVGAGSMLRTGVDARALGMGGAYVAIANSYSAGFWNPAGITKTNSIYVGGMNLDKYGLGLNYNYLSGGLSQIDLPLPSGKKSLINGLLPRSVSFSGTYSGFSTKVQAYTAEGAPLGRILYSERLFKGILGLTLPNLGSLGGSIKNYRFRAPGAGVNGKDATASGLGFDLGFLAQPIKNFRVGIAGFDLSGSLSLPGNINEDENSGGTEIYWKNTPSEPTNIAPSRFSVGAAYSLDLNELPAPEWILGESIISGQYTFGQYVPNKIRAGFEYTFSIFSLRGGAVKPLKNNIAFTAGAGIKVNLVSFDVAWVQNNVLEGSNASDTIVLSSEFTF